MMVWPKTLLSDELLEDAVMPPATSGIMHRELLACALIEEQRILGYFKRTTALGERLTEIMKYAGD